MVISHLQVDTSTLFQLKLLYLPCLKAPKHLRIYVVPSIEKKITPIPNRSSASGVMTHCPNYYLPVALCTSAMYGDCNGYHMQLKCCREDADVPKGN